MGTVADMPTGVALSFEGVHAVYLQGALVFLARGIHLEATSPTERKLWMRTNTLSRPTEEFEVDHVVRDGPQELVFEAKRRGEVRVVSLTPEILAGIPAEDLWGIDDIRAFPFDKAVEFFKGYIALDADYLRYSALRVEDLDNPQ